MRGCIDSWVWKPENTAVSSHLPSCPDSNISKGNSDVHVRVTRSSRQASVPHSKGLRDFSHTSSSIIALCLSWARRTKKLTVTINKIFGQRDYPGLEKLKQCEVRAKQFVGNGNVCFHPKLSILFGVLSITCSNQVNDQDICSPGFLFFYKHCLFLVMFSWHMLSAAWLFINWKRDFTRIRGRKFAQSEGNRLVNRGTRFSAASDTASDGFCFQGTGKTQNTLLSKADVITEAELSEIAPSAWRGRVCSRSPLFGRIPVLLCSIYWFSQIHFSVHQIHMTSPADGRSPARQLKQHTQVRCLFTTAKKK